ncbi:hypothetical protein [Pantoea ananatis]|uniref:hypothetical protein n=1 Tax=Pantoea ananas TaxID=553 RepID=UPI0025C9AD1C|nr:hypothetical protein [Pantoea ananatis]MDN4130033.1 hypothetical protein [Pantoea ananatis]MDN4153255.1 hypothetical protein [Pantoea ananatis]
MNIDAEITKKIRRQREQLSTGVNRKAPRLLSNNIDLARAVERLRESQAEAEAQPKKKRAIVI